MTQRSTMTIWTRAARSLWGALFALAAMSPAIAHKSSDAYLVYQVSGVVLTQRLDIALRDLDRDLTLDADDDGQLSWGEVRTRWPEIEALLTQQLQLRADGQACAVVSTAAPQLDEHSDGRYAVLMQTLRCPAPVRRLELDYRVFAGSDASHRGIVRVVAQGGAEQSAVLVPGAGAQSFSMDPREPATAKDHAAPLGFLGFVIEGIHHIAVGFDHILFLVTLLMVAVWRRDGAGWVPRSSARSAWRETLRLVTAFTFAHSLTLGLATAGLLAPPSRWIESLIAASVLVAAVDNLRPFVKGPRWLMVAVFGLVHGFGFAGPLQALGLERGHLAVPLLGFNLGVEIGQMGLVALLLPLACALRESRFYATKVVRLASSGIAVVALFWLCERSLDISLWP